MKTMYKKKIDIKSFLDFSRVLSEFMSKFIKGSQSLSVN